MVMSVDYVMVYRNPDNVNTKCVQTVSLRRRILTSGFRFSSSTCACLVAGAISSPPALSSVSDQVPRSAHELELKTWRIISSSRSKRTSSRMNIDSDLSVFFGFLWGPVLIWASCLRLRLQSRVISSYVCFAYYLCPVFCPIHILAS